MAVKWYHMAQKMNRVKTNGSIETSRSQPNPFAGQSSAMSFPLIPCCDKCKLPLPKAKDLKDEDYDYPEECQDGWCMWQVCPQAGCGHWTIVSIGRWCKAHGHLVAHRSPAAAQAKRSKGWPVATPTTDSNGVLLEAAEPTATDDKLPAAQGEDAKLANTHKQGSGDEKPATNHEKENDEQEVQVTSQQAKHDAEENNHEEESEEQEEPVTTYEEESEEQEEPVSAYEEESEEDKPAITQSSPPADDVRTKPRECRPATEVTKKPNKRKKEEVNEEGASPKKKAKNNHKAVEKGGTKMTKTKEELEKRLDLKTRGTKPFQCHGCAMWSYGRKGTLYCAKRVNGGNGCGHDIQQREARSNRFPTNLQKKLEAKGFCGAMCICQTRKASDGKCPACEKRKRQRGDEKAHDDHTERKLLKWAEEQEEEK